VQGFFSMCYFHFSTDFRLILRFLSLGFTIDLIIQLTATIQLTAAIASDVRSEIYDIRLWHTTVIYDCDIRLRCRICPTFTTKQRHDLTDENEVVNEVV